MRPLLIVAVVLFLVAALSAFSASVHFNQVGFIALGLAAFAGDQLASAHGVGWNRPLARRGFRRTL